MRKSRPCLGDLPNVGGGLSFLKQNTICLRKNIHVVNDAIKIWASNHNYVNKNVTVKYNMLNSQCKLSTS